MSVPRGSEAVDAMAAADRLERDGRLLHAIDVLSAASRTARRPEIERQLVRLRHEAFAHLEPPATLLPWPPAVAGDGVNGLRRDGAVSADELTPEVAVGGILTNGYVHVRHLIPERGVTRLVEGIDRAFEAAQALEAGTPVSETTPWYEPFTPDRQYKLGAGRGWVRQAGGVWLADSPRVMQDFLEITGDAGLLDLLAACFGERPAMSMRKSTLRRVRLDASSDWHQDGAFMGEDIRTINVWLCLSHCGLDAPGLDIVPQRLPGLVETGTEGARFPWAVAPDVVERTCTTVAVARPMFEPGDAMLFDHLFLHRTACDPAMTRERYAIETWFFAPSAYPDTQIPLMV